MVEILVIGLLTLWASWALIRQFRKKGGCCGSCDACPHACHRKK